MKFKRIVRIARTSARIVRSADIVPISTDEPGSTSRTHSDKVSSAAAARLQHAQLRCRDFGPDGFNSQRTLHRAPPGLDFDRRDCGWIDGEPCGSHHGCAACAALVPGQLNENSLRDSSMGSRLMRVYRALVASRPGPQRPRAFLLKTPLFRFWLLHSNHGLLHSSRLGETCPPTTDAVGSAGFGLNPQPAHRDKTAMNGPQLLRTQGYSLPPMTGPPAWATQIYEWAPGPPASLFISGAWATRL